MTASCDGTTHPARDLREPEVRRDGWWCWCVGCRLWVRIGRDGRVEAGKHAAQDYAHMDGLREGHGRDVRNLPDWPAEAS